MARDRGEVVAVSRSARHGPRKARHDAIRLLEGLGVEGDAHLGRQVQHLSRKRVDPELPNLRQVHLIGIELLERLNGEGFGVAPGDMGENVTTSGIDLLAMPRGTTLRLGDDALVALTGLRNPCRQLDGLQPDLMAAVLARDVDGQILRLAGVMGVVVAAGEVRVSDPIMTMDNGAIDRSDRLRPV